jgi:hypothetical protein
MSWVTQLRGVNGKHLVQSWMLTFNNRSTTLRMVPVKKPHITIKAQPMYILPLQACEIVQVNLRPIIACSWS